MKLKINPIAFLKFLGGMARDIAKKKKEKKPYVRVRKCGNKLQREVSRHTFLKAAPKRIKKRLSGSEKRRRKAKRDIIVRPQESKVFIPMFSKVEK